MENKDTTPDKRKKLNLAVKREFQMWLLVRIIGVVLVSSLVAVLILYIYARQEISSSFYTAHIQIRRVSDLLFPVMAAGALVSLLSGIVLALFLPQKLAGPIYRVQKDLEVIKEGDLTEHIVLRRNDTLMDLADSVNETTAGLRTRIQEVKEIQQELDQVIASIEHQEAAAVSARQNAALERFRTKK
jgi:methyl-accepting chemotaxis protein